jgi:hypothetical protein
MSTLVWLNGRISEYFFIMDVGTNAHVLLAKGLDMTFDVGVFL